MNRLNPTAVVLWGFTGCVGYLIGGDITGAVIGLAVGLGFSLLVSALP